MPHLTFVLMTALHPNCEKCVHRPAVYVAVFAIDKGEPDATAEEQERMAKNVLLGATVCAN